MSKYNVGVTVFCTTYNHGKYISSALDSFLMQKTNFKYEIVIHDDASTDETTEIIREYAKKHDNIIPVIEEHNMFHQGIPYATICRPFIHGKYIALCEGDDFWSDPFKLQQQYDALEQNKQCSFCSHRTKIIDAKSNKTKGYYPQFIQNSGIIDSRTVLEQMGLYGTCYRWSSVFVPYEKYFEYIDNPPEFKKASDVGDGPLLMYFAQLDNIYYINKSMSCYRVGVQNSWTVSIAKEKDRRIDHFEKWKHSIELFDTYTNKKYHSECKMMKNYWEYNKQIFLKNYSAIKDPKYSKIVKSQRIRQRVKMKLLLLKSKITN